MNINITWTITAVIAVSSFLSPVAVAVINNRHHAKIRKLELEHDEYMRQLDLQQQLMTKQFDIYYSDKRNVFSELMDKAGNYIFNTQKTTSYNSLHASIDRAILFCSTDNQIKLYDFLKYTDEIFGRQLSPNERSKYSETVNSLSLALNAELKSTKPVIDCERCEH